MLRVQVPAGTVTFMFTDIEGSTKLWEAHPETMRVSLARHDALMREAIASSNGYVFKTVGDAFCAAFATAQDALEALVSAQLALRAEPWPGETPIKVRAALHTGAAESRDDDYFGPSVHRVARLLSTAHGGQSVLSQTTYDLVRDFLAKDVSIRDLGAHKLKDLARPEQVFELLHPLLPTGFPPLRSLSTHPNNLPLQLTSFIGRDKEAEDLETLLGKSRLVTLTGSGGTGKTRLSLQVAANSLERFPDGAWLVELAPVNDASLVESTVANVLGVKEEPGMPILQALTEYLRTKHLLLVLDNCEHLLVACATMADALVRQCPELVVLATSREGLGIPGETTYRVPSLSLPDPKRSQTAEGLSHFEAVRLFIDRAIQVQKDFSVTNQNAPALASVCFQLDGIPLAIELAAARVRSLSVEEINQRLDQRFRLLTGGSRTALQRQQTHRSLIDWSYDLLGEAEKLMLQRLSVFAGGWSLEAAEAVCSGDPVEDWETLDLLTSLGDKSLLVAEQQGGSTRYRLLETVRQYARDRLQEAGDGPAWRDRHLDFFVALAEEARPNLRGPDQITWLERLETDHDNLRAALDWSCADVARSAAGLRLAAALWRFWLLRGHFSEGRAMLSRAIGADTGGQPAVRARALNGAGVLAESQCDFAAARALHDESLAISQGLGDQWCTAMSLNNIGNLFGSQGDFENAWVYWEQSLRIWRELDSQGDLGDKRGIAATLDNLGNVAYSRGDLEGAQARYEECLAIRREIGNLSGVAYSQLNLGTLAYVKDDHPAARTLFRECLRICKDLSDPIGVAYSLEGLALLEEPVCAARLWGAAEGLRQQVGAPRPHGDRQEYERHVAAARTALGDDAGFEAAWVEGQAMTMEQASDVALEVAGA